MKLLLGIGHRFRSDDGLGPYVVRQINKKKFSGSGGIGTITGTVIGAFIIGVLNNGMSLLGVPTFYQLIIKGLIIILAVWFDVLSKKKKA